MQQGPKQRAAWEPLESFQRRGNVGCKSTEPAVLNILTYQTRGRRQHGQEDACAELQVSAAQVREGGCWRVDGCEEGQNREH